MDLNEVLSRRDEINGMLLNVIDRATNPWGMKVTRIEIRDLTPPVDITAAMAKQMKAEREKRAEILIAEGEKQLAILRSEGEKRAAVLEAEGRKEAAFRDAEARERLAQAEAKATEMVSEAIAKGDVQAINYFIAQKYVDAFGKLAESDQQKPSSSRPSSPPWPPPLAGWVRSSKRLVFPKTAGRKSWMRCMTF